MTRADGSSRWRFADRARLVRPDRLRSVALCAWAVMLLLDLTKSKCLASAPVMPKAFSRETIGTLLKAVDEGENATILKYGYFMRPGGQRFPTRGGLFLVREEERKETSSNRRHFVLLSVLAFAALPLEPATEGLPTYNRLLREHEAADKAGATDVIQTTIHDLVVYLPRSGVEGAAGAGDTLALALDVFLEYLKGNRWQQKHLSWSDAADAANGKELAEHLEKALKNPLFPHSYALYRTAGEIYAKSQPERAIEMLQKAKALSQGEDTGELSALYGDLRDLLVGAKRLPEAIAVQQDLIRRTGAGRADLATLLVRSGDRTALLRLAGELETPDADETEIIAVALLLYEQDPHDQASDTKKKTDEAERLLEEYLGTPRARGVEADLEARWLLIQLYRDQGATDKIKPLLQVTYQPEQLATARSRLIYRAMQRLSTEPTGK